MNRNPEVDRWFEQASHPLEATMRRARDIILGADGRVTESIKWKTPTFATGATSPASTRPSTCSASCSTEGPRSRVSIPGWRATAGRPGGRRPRLVRLESDLGNTALSLSARRYRWLPWLGGRPVGV